MLSKEKAQEIAILVGVASVAVTLRAVVSIVTDRICYGISARSADRIDELNNKGEEK